MTALVINTTLYKILLFQFYLINKKNVKRVSGSEMSNVNIHAREPFISRPGYVFLAAGTFEFHLALLFSHCKLF